MIGLAHSTLAQQSASGRDLVGIANIRQHRIYGNIMGHLRCGSEAEECRQISRRVRKLSPRRLQRLSEKSSLSRLLRLRSFFPLHFMKPQRNVPKTFGTEDCTSANVVRLANCIISRRLMNTSGFSPKPRHLITPNTAELNSRIYLQLALKTSDPETSYS